MPGPESARTRLQKSLEKLGHARLVHASGAGPSQSRRSRIAPEPATAPIAPMARVPQPAQEPEPEPEAGPTAAEMALELIERLDRIEERLSELTRPVRPIPATRELFAEWVRLRKWEEMAFGDFLKLRRSGVV